MTSSTAIRYFIVVDPGPQAWIVGIGHTMNEATDDAVDALFGGDEDQRDGIIKEFSYEECTRELYELVEAAGRGTIKVGDTTEDRLADVKHVDCIDASSFLDESDIADLPYALKARVRKKWPDVISMQIMQHLEYRRAVEDKTLEELVGEVTTESATALVDEHAPGSAWHETIENDPALRDAVIAEMARFLDDCIKEERALLEYEAQERCDA